jgi:SAM-dependent methyltransferase
MKHCPACSNESFELLIDFGTIPKSGVYLDSPEAPFPTIHLAHEFCTSCGLIRQKAIESGSYDYSRVDRATTRQFPKYIDQIIRSLSSYGIALDDTIIEIGSNDGGFLDRLSTAGFSRLIGIEPSIACNEVSRSKGHSIISAHWDENTAASVLNEHGAARAVICRHTLEHVPHPLEFLRAIRSILAPDGIVFIEVPDARPITHDLRGHELWDEHLHIFTKTNLQLIMRQAGFEVTRCNAWPERSDINLLLWARAAEVSQNCPHPSAATQASEIQLCREFEVRWKGFSSRLQADAASWSRPVYMLGASHPQTNFIYFTGIESSIDAFIDDSLVKASLLIPLAQPTPIFLASKLLESSVPGTIIRGAFGYEEWMDRATAPLASESTTVVKPLTNQLS